MYPISANEGVWKKASLIAPCTARLEACGGAKFAKVAKPPPGIPPPMAAPWNLALGREISLWGSREIQ